jgi:multifunctional methyltransferase subunit TRM112
MRLLTHNMLVCNVKACVETSSRTPGVVLNFPLLIEPAAGGLKMVETEFRADLIVHLLPKLDWAALRKTAQLVGYAVA